MIKILLISDLHLTSKGTPENQGQVLFGFIQDLEKTLDKNNYINNFCIISGDLTMDGVKSSFEFFQKNVISHLLRFMPLDNIFVTPGNHDLNRNIISPIKNNIDDFLNNQTGETEFNNALEKDKKNPLIGKFKSFSDFCNKNLNLPNFNIYGYYVNPIPSVSICLLNSVLCSFGGLDGIEDSGHLRVYTRIVNEWIQNNIGRKKILVMHHPLTDLEYEYSTELTQLIESDVDVLINGHTHFDKVNNITINNRQYLHFQAPQLFSSKKDNNAYAVIHIDSDSGQIKDIVFRQWIDRRKCFSNGVDFNDEGIFRNDGFIVNSLDDIEVKLQNRLDEAMKSFSIKPSWRERYLDENSPNRQTANSGDWDYMRIINSSENIQICAAAQFGLTCYGLYLSLKAWQHLKQHWIYVDMKDIRPSQLDNHLTKAKNFHGDILEDEVACLILDNWPFSSDSTNRLLTKIRKSYPKCRLVFCVESLDANIVDGLDSEFSDNLKILYMRHLSRKEMRAIVQEINHQKNFADDNHMLLDRLDADFRDLNMHRTPFNCIQFLMALAKNYEERPINRTKVLDNVLGFIFDNPGSLSYQSNLPDAETCKYIVGYFCEYLYRREPFNELFAEEEFYSVCQDFCTKEFHGTNPRNILRAFINNQIVVADFNGMLKFRFLYWICYFASDRMKRNQSFRDFMVNHNILFDLEVVDFYTATDRERADAITMLNDKLVELTDVVKTAINWPEMEDPYSNLKWAMNETRAGITVDQLEKQVSQSNLPDEIKDAIADRDYNSVKPYFQTISRFLDEYYVRNLMLLIRSSCVALRNSEFVDADLKKTLCEAIFAAWNEVAYVLFSITPLMAKNGYSGIGGQRFTLDKGFPVDEFNECVKQIMIYIPQNIVNWFGGDIFNSKNAPLYYSYIDKGYPSLIRHFAALLIVQKRPSGYKEIILKYISSLSKNSYYLGNLTQHLKSNYITAFMNKSDQKKTLELLAECYNNRGLNAPIFDRDERKLF